MYWPRFLVLSKFQVIIIYKLISISIGWPTYVVDNPGFPWWPFYFLPSIFRYQNLGKFSPKISKFCWIYTLRNQFPIFWSKKCQNCWEKKHCSPTNTIKNSNLCIELQLFILINGWLKLNSRNFPSVFETIHYIHEYYSTKRGRILHIPLKNGREIVLAYRCKNIALTLRSWHKNPPLFSMLPWSTYA